MNKPDFKHNTIIIGGGQAGLTTGYYLQQQGRDFIILDAHQRTGDSWRQRWDSLRLFTPARYSSLPGMPFPARPDYFPTKNEMADYLEAYAARFDLPVRTGVRVERLSKNGDRFSVLTNAHQFEADNVVVAMANYQHPRVPFFASDLDSSIVQFHSSEYRNPSQLQAGDVLVVGAGNSGAEIALETARSRPTWLSGQYPGYIPFRIETTAAQHVFIPFVLRFLFHRVLTVDTPIGRKIRQKALHRAGPLVRTKPKDITSAGIQRVPRTVGVQDGFPLLDDGRVLEVTNVIWCTGFQPGFSWIELPVFTDQRDAMHERGVVSREPGLYFVGLHFLTALSSAQIHGIGRDAAYVAEQLAAHSRVSRTEKQPASFTSNEQILSS